MNNEDSEDIKAILVGMSGAGKTNIINAMIDQPFESNKISTLTSSFVDKYFELSNIKYHIELWVLQGKKDIVFNKNFSQRFKNCIFCI